MNEQKKILTADRYVLTQWFEGCIYLKEQFVNDVMTGMIFFHATSPFLLSNTTSVIYRLPFECLGHAKSSLTCGWIGRKTSHPFVISPRRKGVALYQLNSGISFGVETRLYSFSTHFIAYQWTSFCIFICKPRILCDLTEIIMTNLVTNEMFVSITLIVV